MHSGSHFCAQAASLMRKIKADQQQMLLVKSLKTTALFPSFPPPPKKCMFGMAVSSLEMLKQDL